MFTPMQVEPVKLNTKKNIVQIKWQKRTEGYGTHKATGFEQESTLYMMCQQT